MPGRGRRARIRARRARAGRTRARRGAHRRVRGLCARGRGGRGVCAYGRYGRGARGGNARAAAARRAYLALRRRVRPRRRWRRHRVRRARPPPQPPRRAQAGPCGPPSERSGRSAPRARAPVARGAGDGAALPSQRRARCTTPARSTGRRVHRDGARRGQDARRVAAEAPRPWREVARACYLAAGRGLAAAHEVGHGAPRLQARQRADRGDDGRVLRDRLRARARRLSTRPSLVQGTSGELDLEIRRDRSRGRARRWARRRYMAPEQHSRRGRRCARSDQFSFCVALYRGAVRRAAVRGRQLPELADAVHQRATAPRPRPARRAGARRARDACAGCGRDPARSAIRR